MTTSDYLESLQDDLERINTALELEEGTNFTNIADMAQNGDISKGGGSVDFTEYYDGSALPTTASTSYPSIAKTIKKIPSEIVLTLNGTNISYCFYNMSSLTTAPNLDTTNVVNMSYMFNGCTNLANVPLYASSNVTNFKNMFTNATHLSDQSLNNILTMCINATSYTGTKTLYQLGINSGSYYYPLSRMQNLANYQDFINAGWALS